MKLFSEQEALQVDPVVSLETVNRNLQADKMRLERENDDLANEFVNSKLNMQKKIDDVSKFYFSILKLFFLWNWKIEFLRYQLSGITYS